MPENVRLQNLRDFTVQICHTNEHSIVGTGICVSLDGKLVTCAHVVRAAGVDPRNANDTEIGVYFPQAQGGDAKNRLAKIAKYFEYFNDDIVLLQLTGGPSPLAPEQIPIIGAATLSEGNLFRSYGYRQLQQYIACWADGKIQGPVEVPPNSNVQCEPIQLESNQISSGMSGSAVLDTARNLVIGIVSEAWFPDLSTKNRDTAWAVDARVLGLEPLGLSLQDTALPRKSSLEPQLYEHAKQQVAQVTQVIFEQPAPKAKHSWNNAPTILKAWTGRDDLLRQITAEWKDPKKNVTGLIGFGGEGKSSLARKWVDNLLSDPKQPQADGIFWWGFYENGSVDEFLIAALSYLSGERIDPRVIPTSNLRAQIIGAMLSLGRYLFVLDGLEVMQYQGGDQYGLVQSRDLRDVLSFFARSNNESFCLITSRAPVLDLIDYITYTHHDVERLLPADGHTLLKRLGIKGEDAQIDKVVTDWDGHALTLCILAAYLAKDYDGDVKHITEIPTPEANEPRHERVHRVLRRYDEHLTNVDREFLKLFSVFRTPVQESAFQKVFGPLLKLSTKKEIIPQIVSRLLSYRLISFDQQNKAYTTHPLIRNHYFTLFAKGDFAEERAVHEQIKDYYLSIAGDTPQYPTIEDLKPLIEAVYHACEAGAYDESFDLYLERIQQGRKGILTFGRVNFTGLSSGEEFNQLIDKLRIMDYQILKQFFPKGDMSQEPVLRDKARKINILNRVAFCLVQLNRLQESIPFYQQISEAFISVQDWYSASVGCQNLAELHASLGALESSAKAAREALDSAQHVNQYAEEVRSAALCGWVMHLLGKSDEAKGLFRHAEIRGKQTDPSSPYLYSRNGILHADYLCRTGQLDYSRRVTEANLKICELQHWANPISRCYRILGHLDSSAGDQTSALAHYEAALKLARNLTNRDVLIEGLLARGAWYARHMKRAVNAFNDLNEALGYCIESGYRIYEADVRISLAWAYLANSEEQKAIESSKRALQMSQEMGYHWGKVDAQELLDLIA